MRVTKACERLGDLQFASTGLQDGRQRGVPHDLGGMRKSFGENANDLHHLVGLDAELDELLRVCGGGDVGAQMHCGVGIVDPHQTDGALNALQQLQVDTDASLISRVET